jgi:hypothetical protein
VCVCVRVVGLPRQRHGTRGIGIGSTISTGKAWRAAVQPGRAAVHHVTAHHVGDGPSCPCAAANHRPSCARRGGGAHAHARPFFALRLECRAAANGSEPHADDGQSTGAPTGLHVSSTCIARSERRARSADGLLAHAPCPRALRCACTVCQGTSLRISRARAAAPASWPSLAAWPCSARAHAGCRA